MANRISAITLAVAISMAVSACSSGPRVDTRSAERLASSLDRYASQGPSKLRPARLKAANVLKQAYIAGKEFRKTLAPGVPPLEILTKARFEDLATIADRVDRWQHEGMKAAPARVTPESVTERRWRNQFIIDQLRAQSALLEAKRDVARYKDLFTIDEFSYTDSAFIPPQEGVPLGKDVATFTTSFKNMAVFNVYSAGFHIVVKDPALLAPLVDDIYIYNADKDPIQVGESRQIELTCCDSFRNETINLALRQLPENATIKMELVQVTDYSKSNRLKEAQYSAEDNLKLMASKQCESDILSRLGNWTPETADPACQNY